MRCHTQCGCVHVQLLNCHFGCSHSSVINSCKQQKPQRAQLSFVCIYVCACVWMCFKARFNAHFHHNRRLLGGNWCWLLANLYACETLLLYTYVCMYVSLAMLMLPCVYSMFAFVVPLSCCL